MDFTNSPQDNTVGRPRPTMPQRRVFSDFTVRPISNGRLNPAQPARPQSPNAMPASSVADFVPANPTPPAAIESPAPAPSPTPTPRPSAFQPAPVFPAAPATSAPAVLPPEQAQPSQPVQSQLPAEPQAPASTAETYSQAHKLPKHRNETGHAGMVGFIVFVVLTGMLVSPLIPGKMFDSLPGNSQSLSSGEQSLACISTPTQTSSTTVYNSRLGSPITYQYSTTTTQHATCDGKQQTAITGRTSQFNPLGLLINVAIGVIVAVVVAKIWRKIFGTED